MQACYVLMEFTYQRVWREEGAAVCGVLVQELSDEGSLQVPCELQPGMEEFCLSRS